MLQTALGVPGLLLCTRQQTLLLSLELLRSNISERLFFLLLIEDGLWFGGLRRSILNQIVLINRILNKILAFIRECLLHILLGQQLLFLYL